MESPLSPIVANLVMQALERTALESLPFSLGFYVRYVDDIALSIHKENIDNFLNMFNSYHPRLNFTMERGSNSLNFLDVTLIKKDTYLIYLISQTFVLGIISNYFSCHPRCHKMGTIMLLIDRVLLSHPTFHEKNFKFIINILFTNGYSLKLIFESIRKRLHTKFE